MGILNQVSNIGGKFVNLGVVEALDVLEEATILSCHKVNGHTLAAETSGTTDTMQVVLWLCWEIKVDDQGHLQ